MSRNHSSRVRQSLKARTLNAQAEAARMTHAYNMAKGLAQHLTERKRHLEAILHEAKDIAGHLSALFPAETVEVDVPVEVARAYGIRLPRPLSHVELLTAPIAIKETIPVDVLPVLLTSVRRDELQRRTHAIIKFRDRSSGYAITDAAVATLSERALCERIVHAITPDLVRHLVAQLKGKKP